MLTPDPRAAAAFADVNLDALLALNRRFEAETSVLDRAGLEAILAMACFIGLEGPGGRDGFLIAMDQDAPYQSLNYLWFKQRYPRFAYVDRVIVAPEAQGRGVARRLYGELFERSRRAGHEMVGAEIVAEPPNVASDAFHASLGFEEVGRSEAGPGHKALRFVRKLL